MYDARPERGTKRTCQSCEARFYDLTRVPVICPKCGTEFIEPVRPEPVSYRKRGQFGKARPEEPLEPVAEEPRSEDEEHEPGEEDEPDLDSEDEPPADEE